jgi:ubiquinone/menaquinone biosynthesis C-methylase UbiE
MFILYRNSNNGLVKSAYADFSRIGDVMPTHQEIKNWYNSLYSSKGPESMRPFEAYIDIIDCLGVEKGKLLLDISCGTGFLLKAANKAGLKTYGVDISEEAVKIARTTSPESKVDVAMGEDLGIFENGKFDYITCLGSLEHFLDKEKGLQEMHRVAKSSAKFCIMVPNSNFIYWKFKKDGGTAQQDINETLMSKAEWVELFNKCGLQVTDIYQDKWFMKSVKIFSSPNPIKIIKNMVLKTVWLLLPLNLTYQFIFILKKQS